MAELTDRDILAALGRFGPILAIKLYRLTLPAAPAVPTLPCLDHEAMLHEGIAPHVAAYVQDAASGDLHELVFVPDRRKIEVDTVSTWLEYSEASQQRLLTFVKTEFPEYRVELQGPSWWRGERRVATACRAQVTLREVLLGEDLSAVKTKVDRLQTIGTLMEKQSRVASWGVRTVTAPLLGAAGVIIYMFLGAFDTHLGESALTALRYTLLGVLGTWFLYYGLKAVQLTEMGNRVWKRSTEYSLILAERKRLAN